MRYTNFRQNAAHRGTCLTNEQWSALYLALAVVSPLLLIPGFCIWRVFFDVMHCLDLGVYQLAVPSVMQELTSAPGVFPGASVDDRYAAAYREYRLWCKTRRVKAVIGKRFTRKVWRKSSNVYPRISQLSAKAAALRSMTYWVDKVLRERANVGAEVRATMISSFVRADHVCRVSGRHLSVAQHRALCQNLEAALTSYNLLASEALVANKRLYKIIPKFHAVTHTYDLAINPRRVTCYQDEDMVGRMKAIYVKCHGSTAPMRSLQRYCVLVCIRWWELLRVLRGVPL